MNRVNFYRNITNARGWITNKHLFYWLYKKGLLKLPTSYFTNKDDCFRNSKIRFTKGFKGGFPISEYLLMLSQSKINT